MKVIKFGGTSVGTPDSMLKVRDIVVSRPEPPIVVVSALGGVTDQLIRSARLAEEGDPAFRDEIAAMREIKGDGERPRRTGDRVPRREDDGNRAPGDSRRARI